MTNTKPTIQPHPYSDPSGWCAAIADPQLTQHGPPVRVPNPNGATSWLVTRYGDVRTVLSDRRFGRAPTARLQPPQVCPARLSRVTQLATFDPPEHGRLRGLVSEAFSVARSAAWRTRVQRLLDNRLDRLVADGISADLVRQVIDPLSLALLAEAFGIPVADRSRVVGWSRAHHSTAMPVGEFHDKMDALTSYFDALVARRRRRPADDVISQALHLRDLRGQEITDDEIAAICAGVFATGFFALTGQCQISVHALLTHPDELAELRANPELLPGAVEELLRYAPLIKGPLRVRYVFEDLDVGGRMIHAGDLVAPSVSAAGFDPEVFSDPYRLDICRRPVPNLAFGFGTHYCLAAPLGRIVLTAIVSSLIERFPQLRLAVTDEALRWVFDWRLRRLERLPVSW